MPNFAELFAQAGCDGALHALRLSDGAEIGHEADRPWVMASVVKVPIGLAFYSAVAAGRLESGLAVTLAPDDVTPGSVAISRFSDPATMSLRDLAYLMLTISDNAATDVVTEAVGLDEVNGSLRAVGCSSTVVVSDLQSMLDGVAADLGWSTYSALLEAQRGEQCADGRAASSDRSRIDACRALDSAQATRTTARDATRLLSAIWADTAGPAEACATLRTVMAEQVTRRLGPTVQAGGSIAAKAARCLVASVTRSASSPTRMASSTPSPCSPEHTSPLNTRTRSTESLQPRRASPRRTAASLAVPLSRRPRSEDEASSRPPSPIAGTRQSRRPSGAPTRSADLHGSRYRLDRVTERVIGAADSSEGRGEILPPRP